MQLFLDNDIILKLASIGKLNELKNIFKIDDKSIFILPSTPYYLPKSKKVKKNYPKEVIDSAVNIISNFSIIKDCDVNEERTKLLAEVDGIDPGEQILFSISLPTDDYFILTGDKKSLRNLGISVLDEVKQALAGKVICLESILLKFSETDDFPCLVDTVRHGNFCGDEAVRLIFSQQNIDIERVKEGLDSNLREMQGYAGGIVVMDVIET